MQKYPVGFQDFEKIRVQDFVYVDKTALITDIVQRGGYYFLARPRRFGKSLLISTLNYLLSGRKDLFKGLYIEDKWGFEEYPIIRISFSNIGIKTIGLVSAIEDSLLSVAKQYQIELASDKGAIDKQFKELIYKLKEKFDRQVVILIDEYDKPIVDFLEKENIHIAKQNKGILKIFYSVLKDADAYLKLVFITGVSKFSQVSIFSDLNNLYDISLKNEFNEICGISQLEIEKYFSEELNTYDKNEIKRWYNGYKWHIDSATVYNPFSLLTFFSCGDFRNYWYSTGTPTFLMELSKQQHFYKFSEIEVSHMELQSFDFENIKIIPTLFQTGYLTIVGENKLMRNIILSFPNEEVKEAYLQNLADTYIDSQQSPSKVILSALLKALTNRDPDALKRTINLAFEHIPYSKWEKENENFYHAIIHLLFSLLGIYIESEVQTQLGRADAIVQNAGEIYCFEFKLDSSANDAINQAKIRGYLAKYLQTGKPCHIIGVNFSSASKSVEELVWETLS